MEIKTSKGKEIRIPGPDHPITISPAKGTVRVTVAGRIVAESTRALRLDEKGYPPFTICRVMMRTCRCWFGPSITPIVRIRVIVRTTAFPSAHRDRNTPFGHTKSLMSQSPASRSIWHFIPHGLMQSK
jgi:hypothetical protein